MLDNNTWRPQAVCLDTDPDVFFPDDEEDEDQAAPAKAICAVCPVQADCREYAIATYVKHGIFGGMNSRERRNQGRRNRRAAQVARETASSGQLSLL